MVAFIATRLPKHKRLAEEIRGRDPGTTGRFPGKTGQSDGKFSGRNWTEFGDRRTPPRRVALLSLKPAFIIALQQRRYNMK
jgi:hypothetical protein